MYATCSTATGAGVSRSAHCMRLIVRVHLGVPSLMASPTGAARRHTRRMGVEWLPLGYGADNFGHVSQLPQIYRLFGIFTPRYILRPRVHSTTLSTRIRIVTPATIQIDLARSDSALFHPHLSSCVRVCVRRHRDCDSRTRHGSGRPDGAHVDIAWCAGACSVVECSTLAPSKTHFSRSQSSVTRSLAYNSVPIFYGTLSVYSSVRVPSDSIADGSDVLVIYMKYWCVFLFCLLLVHLSLSSANCRTKVKKRRRQ